MSALEYKNSKTRLFVRLGSKVKVTFHNKLVEVEPVDATSTEGESLIICHAQSMECPEGFAEIEVSKLKTMSLVDGYWIPPNIQLVDKSKD